MNLELPESIEYIRSMEPLYEEVKRTSLQVAPKPFAHGSMRLAYYGRRLFPVTDYSSEEVYDVPADSGPFQDKEEVVLKEFMKPPRGGKA